MALATLPLTATLVLGAGPDLLGLLVAAQSAAWLLVSLPAGAWIDRLPRRRMLIVALALGLASFPRGGCGGRHRPGAPAGPRRHRRRLGHRRLCPDLGLAVAEPRGRGRPAPLQRAPRTGAGRRQSRRAVRGRPARPASFADLGLCARSPRRGPGWSACSPAGRHAPATQGERPTLATPSGSARSSSSATTCCAASASARSSGTSPSLPCRHLGPLAPGPLGSIPPIGPRAIDLWRRLILGALVAPISARRLPPFATLIFGPAVSVVGRFLILATSSGSGFVLAAAGYFLVGFVRCYGRSVRPRCDNSVTPSRSWAGQRHRPRPRSTACVAGALAGGFVAAQAGLQRAR